MTKLVPETMSLCDAAQHSMARRGGKSAVASWEETLP
jgi:hypothetical protein